MDAHGSLLKVREKLDECRSILDTEMYSDPTVDLESDDFKLLRKVYDSICSTEDLFI